MKFTFDISISVLVKIIRESKTFAELCEKGEIINLNDVPQAVPSAIDDPRPFEKIYAYEIEIIKNFGNSKIEAIKWLRKRSSSDAALRHSLIVDGYMCDSKGILLGSAKTFIEKILGTF